MLSCCSAFWLAQLAFSSWVQPQARPRAHWPEKPVCPPCQAPAMQGLQTEWPTVWLDAEAFFGWQDVLAADGILLEAVQDGEGTVRICVAGSIDQAHDFEPFLATRAAQSQTIK